MKDKDFAGAKAVASELEKRGYNPQPTVISEYNVITGQKISIDKIDEGRPGKHFEDDGAYADDSNED